MNLTVDQGNTRLKAGIFSGTELQKVILDPSLDELRDLLKETNIEAAIISSVRQEIEALKDLLRPVSMVFELTPTLDVPVKNLYRSPQTLGMDRLAAVVGANELYPQEHCLVIDAGTSITYDLIDDQGIYRGGGISPGLHLRFKALNDHTSKLPLIEIKDADVALIGNDTQSSIRSGVLHGTTAEIEGIIRRYEQKFSNLKVLLCGGDAAFFESMLKASIFVVPHLVLIGLNSILMHHAKGN